MKPLKLPVIAMFITGVFTLLFFSCQKNTSDPTLISAAGKKTSLDNLTISCGTSTGASINLTVCAGASGAPAGFSIQWMLRSEYVLYGWPSNSDDPNTSSFCKASLSGVPGCATNYSLASNACTTVNIGDNLFDDCGASSDCAGIPLDCGTQYVFRAFAHNDPKSGLGKSGFTSTLTCATLSCGQNGGCTFTQGYWKTHGPVPTGNNLYVWPQAIKDNGLTIGTVQYTASQLLSIFNTPAQGNGLLSLAHQLIAADLNLANGANGSTVTQAIADANALIGGLVIPPVGSGYLSSSATSALTTALGSYNEGLTGPGHCSE